METHNMQIDSEQLDLVILGANLIIENLVADIKISDTIILKSQSDELSVVVRSITDNEGKIELKVTKLS